MKRSSRNAKPPNLTDVQTERARRKLSYFFRASWHVLEPATPLADNWHIDAMADHAQAVLEDWIAVQRARQAGLETPAQRIQNLVINVPPGTAKSRLISVCLPAWMWLRWPEWRAICISGNPRVSVRDSMLCRDLIRSKWYQRHFSPYWSTRWTITKDQDQKTLFKNSAGGQRQAMGVRAKITGDRADALIIDDPNDAAEIESVTAREGVIEWYDMGAGNRVNDLATSARLLVMQRLHEADMAGHVLKSGAWAHLLLPMEFDPSRAAPSPIGWQDPRTVEGELLFPTRFPPHVLEAERKRLGSRGYAGQMQQSPVPAAGAIFREDWFGSYKLLPVLAEVWSAWDTAMKTGQDNDESACCVAGKGVDGRCYILRVWHDRLETPDLAEFLVSQALWLKGLYGDRYKGDYVEDKVSGTTLMQYVRRSNPGLALIPVKCGPAEGDKSVRAHGVTPICEAGSVVFPDETIFPNSRQWRADLVAQLLKFPLGVHDDIVDAFVYAVKRFMGTIGGRKSRRGKAGGQT